MKTLLFAGVLGILAGPLAYSQQGAEPDHKVAGPHRLARAVAILSGSLAYSQAGSLTSQQEPPLPDDRPQVVIGRFYVVADPGPYGVHVVLQKRSGESFQLPKQGVVKMKNGDFKKMDEVAVGDELF